MTKVSGSHSGGPHSLERAIAIASQAHADQVDKAGQPYLLHPLRIMLAVQGAQERIAAVIHDVVEDTTVRLDDLRGEGFSSEVLEAVDALTKRAGETRLIAAARAKVNRIARTVNIADVTDNMNLQRIDTPTQKDFDRLKEYGAVKAFLLEGAR